jgi:membrane fusion protein (multidrug efflux system)
MQPAASIFITLLFTVAAAACHRKAAAEVTKTSVETSVSVATAIAEAVPTPDILTLTGSITADQRAEVTAEAQGKVLAVMVERGQRVKRGQPVVRLDVSAAALHGAEASAQLQTARSDQRLADAECARSRKLFAMGAISGAEAERTSAQCSSAGSQVSAAQARSAMIGKGVRDGIVRAPFDGVVVSRGVTAGEWVAPGRSLFTLIDADPLRLELTVPEARVADLQLGQRVELSTVARPNAAYRATITRLGAEIGASRSLIVEATVEPTPELVPGMFVEARVVTGQTLRPVLPASAVVLRGKVWHVFVVYEGIARERIVQLGPSPGPGTVSIVQSITAGETVVHTITDQIVDGLRVN